MKVDKTTQDKNGKIIYEAYKANGDSISCNTDISVRDSTGLVDSFQNVNIVFAVGKNGYVQIDCDNNDFDRYKSYGFKRKYYVYESK